MNVFWLKIAQHKKVLVAGLAIIAAIKMGIVYTSNHSRVNPAFQTTKIDRGDLYSRITATGTIKPLNIVDISSRITAQIKEMKVKENEIVKTGQVLVILEDTGLQAQVIQAQVRLDNAAASYARTKRLNKIGAFSVQQLDDSAMAYHIAQASYDEIVSKLNEAVITSPIDGVVIGKPLPAGQMVAQGVNNPTVILTIADMSKMQIETRVDETDINKIKVGQKVNFLVDGQPEDIFEGTVSVISQKATVEQNVITYLVVIDVNDAQQVLKPSMTARVNIAISERKNVLHLPLTAVHDDKRGKYVVVVKEDGSFSNVKVVTGIIDEDRVEILGGLSDEDIVVISHNKSVPTTSDQKSGGPANPLGGIMRRM